MQLSQPYVFMSGLTNEKRICAWWQEGDILGQPTEAPGFSLITLNAKFILATPGVNHYTVLHF